MKKSKILATYDKTTGQSYKFQPLYVGDVYKNEFGTMGIVLQNDDGNYVYKKTNMHEHKLPEDKAGLYNSEFVANVIQDDKLMDEFIRIGIIEDDAQEVVDKKEQVVNNDIVVIIEDKEPTVITDTKDVDNTKDECKKVATTKKGETVEEKETKQVKTKKVTTKEEPKLNIYQKINLVRKAWAEANIDKEGKGRAGGGAKYDYYKPQQVIDFCLAQELKYNLYSRFAISNGVCAYELLNLDNTDEFESVNCPFDVPRKMAASEAQQIGAAMTYYNRRLAMLMYKIEDNSKESVDVLEKADYTKDVEIPIIPAPPVAPVVAPTVPTTVPTVSTMPTVPSVPTVPTVPAVSQVEEVAPVKTIEQNVQPEVTSKHVNDSKIEDNKTIVEPPKIAVPPVVDVPFVADVVTPPTTDVPAPPKMGSIESLY